MPFDLSKLTTQILSDKLGSSAEIDIDTFHSFIVSLFELDYDPELLKTELAEFIPDDTVCHFLVFLNNFIGCFCRLAIENN